MKKIIFVISQMSGGGAERVVSVLGKEFKKKGYDISLVLSNQSLKEAVFHNDIFENKVISLKDEVKKADENKLLMLSARFVGKFDGEIGSVLKFYSRNFLRIKFMKKFFDNNKDATVISFLYDSIFLSLLSVNKSNKLIISERGDPQQSRQSKTDNAFFKRMFKKADYLVCQSPDAAKWYRENAGLESKIIFNPIKEGLPMPFVGERKKNIVNFCRIDPQKDLCVLFDAFDRFNKLHPDYLLEIYGDSADDDYYMEVCSFKETLACKKNIFMYPAKKDIHNIVKDSAMFVSSSFFEGMSNSMLEAMALGLPVICTDCPAGGARAVIENNVNGLLVPVKDSKAMCEAMCRLAEDNELCEKLSENAVKIRETQSIEKIVEEWEILL